MPVRRFGPYEVLARLATGGAANIFLARKPLEAGTRRLSVLKTLLPERASDKEFVDMFLDEARLAARLQHPACVEIYDLGKEGGTFYISMEYVVGETLWGLLASVPETRQPLPPMVVASIIASACEGLHHAHELTDPNGHPYNLVHRDVSPQNIMVSYDGQTKVLDFGIAKAETGREATATGIVKGKFSYMSPEQITGGAVDRRSDIYSLGIVLFECLAARRLYRADTPEEIARLMLERRPPRLRDLIPDADPVIDAICAKALSRHPQHRYNTAREMADALREHLHAHRFTDGVLPVQRLVEERFGPRIAERRKLLERVTSGTVDEAELLRVLGARPVMDVDLYPAPDDELLAGARPMSAIDTETPADEAPPGRIPSTGSSLDRRGVRVELRSTGTPPETIELSDRSPRLSRDDEGSTTRLDGDSTVLEGLESAVRREVPALGHTEAEAEEVEELDTRRFDVHEELAALEDVPVAQPRKKEGVRSDPRAPTRALASRRVAAATEPKVEVVKPIAKPTIGRGEGPEPAAVRAPLEPRFASSGLTSPVMPGNTDPLGMGMVQEPRRLVEDSSASGPAAYFVVPDIALTPRAGTPAQGPDAPVPIAVPSVSAPPPGGVRGGATPGPVEHPLVSPVMSSHPPSMDSALARAVVPPGSAAWPVAPGTAGGSAPAPWPPAAAPGPSFPPPPVALQAEPLSAGYGSGAPEAQTYSLGVVLAALAFGVTLGLLLGVLVSLFTR